MAARALAAILALMACAGLVWAGIGFAGFALMSFLTDFVGWPAAAAITAFVFLIVPVGAVVLIGQRVAQARKRRRADAVLAALSRIAAERPIVAVVGAALLGAVEVLLGARRNRNKK